MFFLAILLFFISFVFFFGGGKLLGRKASVQVGFLNNLLSYIIIIIYLWEALMKNDIYILTLGDFLNIDLLLLNWSIYIDRYTLLMSFVVSTVSLLVILYSVEYMAKDISKLKFFAYLNLFTFFMLVFISSGNFIQMFLGWEGIGICSYLLIIFWDTRISAIKSAIKAIIVNKLGDLAFIFMLCLLFFLTGSLSTIFINIINILVLPDTVVLAISPTFNINLLNLLTFSILIALVGKSAQIGLHIWLPDAMEGPTPVSALLHAATMVTAGVFLSLRIAIFLELSTVSYWFALIGGFTALYASILGFCQEDLKKSIAYSTCSQLGYMVLICSLSGYNLAFFHLFNHAFFKASLFLTAGCLIHNSLEEQDLRILGGFSLRSPILFSSMFIGGTALLALPFLSGFYSKEIIINMGLLYASLNSTAGFFFGLTAAIFTVLYTGINTFDLFFGDLHYKNLLKSFHPTSLLMSVILTLLTILSFWSGFLCSDLFLGIGVEDIIYFQINTTVLLTDIETLGFYTKYLPTVLSLILALFSLSISDNYYIRCSKFFFKYLNLDDFYFKFFTVTSWRKYSSFIFYIDRGILEIFGPQGAYSSLGRISLYLTGFTNYLLINYITLTVSFSWLLCIFLTFWY